MLPCTSPRSCSAGRAVARRQRCAAQQRRRRCWRRLQVGSGGGAAPHAPPDDDRRDLQVRCAGRQLRRSKRAWAPRRAWPPCGQHRSAQPLPCALPSARPPPLHSPASPGWRSTGAYCPAPAARPRPAWRPRCTATSSGGSRPRPSSGGRLAGSVGGRVGGRAGLGGGDVEPSGRCRAESERHGAAHCSLTPARLLAPPTPQAAGGAVWAEGVGRPRLLAGQLAPPAAAAPPSVAAPRGRRLCL